MAKKEESKKKEGEKGPLARAVTLTVYALAAIAGIGAFVTGLFWGPLTWLEKAGYDKNEKMSAVMAGEDITRAAMKPAQDFLRLGDWVETRPSVAFPSEEELLVELSKPLDSGSPTVAQQRRKEAREAKARAAAAKK